MPLPFILIFALGVAVLSIIAIKAKRKLVDPVCEMMRNSQMRSQALVSGTQARVRRA